MQRFELTILGCGSASPTARHLPACQVVTHGAHSYLVDCGEGAQRSLRQAKVNYDRVRHIFISHLHGDHCFGLYGLLSTLTMLGRGAELHIYSPAPLAGLMRPALEFHCQGTPPWLHFHEFSTEESTEIYHDHGMSVRTLPLDHRVPCCGFLFREDAPLPHILPDMVACHQIPHYALESIKQGNDWTTPEGEVVSWRHLTRPAQSARSYAYCSDSRPVSALSGLLRGVSTLYHEATFAERDRSRALLTHHSTAAEAAGMARECGAKQLIIGHFSARYSKDESLLLDEARAVFPPTDMADEQKTFPL